MEEAVTIVAKRRSRMHRESTGKRIELTPRDLEIFRLLTRYRYLRSTFIHAFVGGNKTKLIERLGHLYHEGGFLDRPGEQWWSANARYQPVVYQITRRAEEVLRSCTPCQMPTEARQPQVRPHPQFAHALMVCEILASIELATRHYPGLRFIPWPEIIAKAPEATRASENPFQIPVPIGVLPGSSLSCGTTTYVVPDALFGLEYQTENKRSFRFFAVEADRASMPIVRNNLRQTSFRKKVLAYRGLAESGIDKAHFGLPNLLVLTVTTNASHMKNIMSLIRELAHEGKSKLFLFKSVSCGEGFNVASVLTPKLLTTGWERVGYEPFFINQP